MASTNNKVSPKVDKKIRNGTALQTSSDFSEGGYPLDLVKISWIAQQFRNLKGNRDGKDCVSNNLKGRTQASWQNAVFVSVKWCVTIPDPV